MFRLGFNGRVPDEKVIAMENTLKVGFFPDPYLKDKWHTEGNQNLRYWAEAVANHRYEVVGVSLEHCVLDLSAVKAPQVGDEVVILGGSGPDEITLAHIAAWWGVGVNDVLMTFNGRMTQRFSEGSPKTR